MTRIERSALTVAAIYQREAADLSRQGLYMLINATRAWSYDAERHYLEQAAAYQAKAAKRYRDARQVMGLEPLHTA